MSFFKNLFGQKNNNENSLSILQTEEVKTITSDSPKQRLDHNEIPASISPSKSNQTLRGKIKHNVFDNEEFAFFVSLEIVNHEWESFGLNRQEAIDCLYNFISGYIPQTDDLEEDVVNFFYEFQIRLMVKKPVNDFYQLQEFSPFSTQAMRVFLDLLKAHNSGGKSYFLRKFDEIYPPNQQYIHPEEPIRIVEENSGLSIEDAIVVKVIGPNSGLKELPRARLGVNAEYHYLCFNYGFARDGWNLQMQKSLLPINGKNYDCLLISFPSGETRNFYFDITDFRGDCSYLRD